MRYGNIAIFLRCYSEHKDGTMKYGDVMRGGCVAMKNRDVAVRNRDHAEIVSERVSPTYIR